MRALDLRKTAAKTYIKEENFDARSSNKATQNALFRCYFTGKKEEKIMRFVETKKRKRITMSAGLLGLVS